MRHRDARERRELRGREHIHWIELHLIGRLVESAREGSAEATDAGADGGVDRGSGLQPSSVERRGLALAAAVAAGTLDAAVAAAGALVAAAAANAAAATVHRSEHVNTFDGLILNHLRACSLARPLVSEGVCSEVHREGGVALPPVACVVHPVWLHHAVRLHYAVRLLHAEVRCIDVR